MGLFSPDPQSTEFTNFLRLAVAMAARSVPSHTSRFSRRDFTQPQIIAILLLRARMDCSYNDIVQLLRSSDAMREALGLRKVPTDTTLHRNANEPGMPEVLNDMLRQIAKLAGDAKGSELPRVDEAAIDSTGFESGVASGYFSKRAGKVDQFVKVSLAVAIGWMLPIAMVISLGASNDNRQAPQLVRTMARNAQVRVMYADAGYDGEPLHELCREELGIESIIKPVPKTRDGTIRTKYRSMMVPLPEGYKRRAAVESLHSAIKRTCGSRLRARSDKSLQIEAAMKVVGYAVG